MTLTHPLFSRRKAVRSATTPFEATSLGKAWRWWLAELTACVPSALRQRFAASRARLLLIVDSRGDNLVEVGRGGRRILGRIDLDASSDQQIASVLPRTRTGHPRPITIQLDGHQALRTSVFLPLAAERNLAQVIGFEFERLVPFKQSDVHFAYRITSRNKDARTIGVELIIVPHAAIARIVDALPGWGLQPTEIWVGAGPAETPTSIAIGNESRVRPSGYSGRINLSMGVIAGVLAIACIAIPLWQAHIRIASLDAQIANARRRAEASAALQKQIDALSRDQRFLVDRKEARPTMTDLLAILTQLLPDDTYLTELEVKGDEVRLTGLTSSATALLAAIAKSPSFRDATFESSITRDAKTNRERFDIGAHLAKRGNP